MKKLIAVLALSALAACGGSDEPGSTQNSVTPENGSAETTTPAVDPAATPAPDASAPTIDPATPATVDSSATAAPAAH